MVVSATPRKIFLRERCRLEISPTKTNCLPINGRLESLFADFPAQSAYFMSRARLLRRSVVFLSGLPVGYRQRANPLLRFKVFPYVNAVKRAAR